MSAILDRIAGQTIPRAFLDTVAARGDAVALRWKDGDDWQEMTFAEYRDLVARAAAGLGLSEEQFQALLGQLSFGDRP